MKTGDKRILDHSVLPFNGPTDDLVVDDAELSSTRHKATT